MKFTANDLIGKKNIQRVLNMQMEIINAYKIGYEWFVDVQFEDGCIVNKKQLNSFRTGRIGHPTIHMKGKAQFNNREGETSISKSGLKMTIIKYRGSKDIDVQFEDGSIKYNVTYQNFRLGNISEKENKSRNKWSEDTIKNKIKDYTGNKNINKQGLQMTVIKYNRYNDIQVQFEDDTIVHSNYHAFLQGDIVNPNYKKDAHIGETSITNIGYKITLIKYRSCSDIDVQFEDGTIVHNIQYSRFRRGEIRHPTLGKKIISRIGEKGISDDGKAFEIIEYVDSSKVIIRFETGEEFETGYYNIAHGFTFKGLVKARKRKDIIQIGEEAVSNSGMIMKIIGIRKRGYDRMVDVQFEDGAIAENVGYNNFKKGSVSHPNNGLHRNRIGEEVQTKVGLKAYITKWNTHTDFEVTFEDGTQVHRKHNSGKINVPHPKYIKCVYVGSFNDERIFLCTCRKCKGKHTLKLSEMKDFNCNSD